GNRPRPRPGAVRADPLRSARGAAGGGIGRLTRQSRPAGGSGRPHRRWYQPRRGGKAGCPAGPVPDRGVPDGRPSGGTGVTSPNEGRTAGRRAHTSLTTDDGFAVLTL